MFWLLYECASSALKTTTPFTHTPVGPSGVDVFVPLSSTGFRGMRNRKS